MIIKKFIIRNISLYDIIPDKDRNIDKNKSTISSIKDKIKNKIKISYED